MYVVDFYRSRSVKKQSMHADGVCSVMTNLSCNNVRTRCRLKREPFETGKKGIVRLVDEDFTAASDCELAGVVIRGDSMA